MSEEKTTYCVLVPAYNEAESLPELVTRISAVFESMGAAGRFEILIVSDGSTDDTWRVITELAAQDGFVRGIKLRRNCGKSLAITIGFRGTDADVVITMDADLQDRPEDIPAMVEKLHQDADLVSGWRQGRQDRTIRKLGSRLYNATVRAATGLKIHDFNCCLKAYRQDVVRSLVVYGQYHRYIPVIAHLAGFRVDEVPISNDARKFGSSKFRSLRFEGLFDLLSLLFTHRYGLNPLHFFGVIGAILVVPTAFIVLYFVLSQLAYLLGFGEDLMVNNRPLLTVSLNILLVGVIVFFTGFVCDFILHHQIRERISGIVSLSTEATVGAGGFTGSPGQGPDSAQSECSEQTPLLPGAGSTVTADAEVSEDSTTKEHTSRPSQTG